MSFSFMPTPIFLLVVLCFSLVLMFYSVIVFINEDKLLAIGYSLLGLTGLSAVISRGIEKYYLSARHFIVGVNIIMEVFLVCGMGIFFVTAWRKTQKDPIKRKLLVSTLWLLAVTSILMVLVVAIFAKKIS